MKLCERPSSGSLKSKKSLPSTPEMGTPSKKAGDGGILEMLSNNSGRELGDSRRNSNENPDLDFEDEVWISQATQLDDKFYLQAVPPPKVEIFVKRLPPQKSSQNIRENSEDELESFSEEEEEEEEEEEKEIP
jgi:hypothetical protein